MLNVKNLHVHYGAIHALQGVSFNLTEGEIVALIGSNGAGKSTLLNTISGILQATEGEVQYMDEVITGTPAQDIVKKGIIQVPEGRKIFASMTVIENLEMGAYTVNSRTLINERIDQMLEKFPLLKDRRKQLGGTLSGGEQQMLAIARSLMASPKLMLLDEPSMGLAPVLVEQIFDTIEEINEQGTSILLVEQNAQMALSIADRAYVLETGRIVLEGNADKVMKNPMVIKAYLGG
ncbi:MAG: ABC transporter ATP-binding protein [Anaerolineaceae bacterium]|nr:ABC transporter ATP-binding protein [Anaerolineaceae bacterium]